MTARGRSPSICATTSGFAKYTAPAGAGQLEASLPRLSRRPGVRPSRSPSGSSAPPLCPDVFCSPDPTATGETTRFVGNAAVCSGDGWHGNVYGQYLRLGRCIRTRPTPMRTGPAPRSTSSTSAGSSAARARSTGRSRRASTSRSGPRTATTTSARSACTTPSRAQLRVVARPLSRSRKRRRRSTARRPGGRSTGLRLIGGLRGDYYHYDVRRAWTPRRRRWARAAATTRSSRPRSRSPTRSTDQLELYAQLGPGLPLQRRARRGHRRHAGAGAGRAAPARKSARASSSASFTLTTTYWWLDVGSELQVRRRFQRRRADRRQQASRL